MLKKNQTIQKELSKELDKIIKSEDDVELQKFIKNTPHLDLNFKNEGIFYNYPIHLAIATSNNLRIISTLFDSKVDMNIVDVCGWNILHCLAIRTEDSTCVIELLMDLHNKGLYSFHHLLLQETIQNNTPLLTAYYTSNETATLFLKKETAYYKNTLVQYVLTFIHIKDIVLLIVLLCC